MILLIAGTVCAAILITVIGLGVTEFFHPEADTTRAAGAVVNVINTLIGLLAGFLAGRTRARGRDADE